MMMVDAIEVPTVMGMFMGSHNRPTLRSSSSSRCTKLGPKPNSTIIASSSCSTERRTVGRHVVRTKHVLKEESKRGNDDADVGVDDNYIMNKKKMKMKVKKRVFFLDVNSICYNGSTPSLHSFAQWISLFFSEVSLTDPVIAVFDGEGAHEQRRQILPSYKSHRRRFSPWISASREAAKSPVGRSHRLISDFLTKCNVPVVKIPAQEADDVVATLVDQVVEKGYRAVIASPDKDFKQLICEDVQLVMPLPELKRWSFYTLDHYITQYKCDPLSDLSLRCIVGDEADGIPGIQHLVPGFGMKTALKLLKKHGSIENLLNAAATRTVGKPYVQDALTKHASHFRRNYELLSLRRDVDIRLQEDWLHKRCMDNDLETISDFLDLLGGTQKRKRPYASG